MLYVNKGQEVKLYRQKAKTSDIRTNKQVRCVLKWKQPLLLLLKNHLIIIISIIIIEEPRNSWEKKVSPKYRTEETMENQKKIRPVKEKLNRWLNNNLWRHIICIFIIIINATVSNISSVKYLAPLLQGGGLKYYNKFLQFKKCKSNNLGEF